MNPRKPLALTVAALAAGALAAPAAGAGVRWNSPTSIDISDRDLCQITAQPWDQRTYALEADVDGTVAVLIAKTDQGGDHFEPRSWYFPAGLVTEVRWAWMGDRWGDTLPVNADCEFTVDYQNAPGKQDSVVIARVPYGGPTTTTEAAPTTTSTTPTSTTASVPPVPPPTIFPATTTPTPVALDVSTPLPDEPLVEAPTTSLPTVTADTLPVTGAGLEAGLLGGAVAGFGGLSLAASSLLTRLRRHSASAD